MSLSERPPGGEIRARPNVGRMLTWWFALMSLAGLLLGSLVEQRSFGGGVLVHPLMVFAVAAGIGLLILRVVLRRPGSEFISNRRLIIACAVGLVAFLIGNWFGTHLAALR
jgi:hypothetical protein